MVSAKVSGGYPGFWTVPPGMIYDENILMLYWWFAICVNYVMDFEDNLRFLQTEILNSIEIVESHMNRNTLKNLYSQKLISLKSFQSHWRYNFWQAQHNCSEIMPEIVLRLSSKFVSQMVHEIVCVIGPEIVLEIYPKIFPKNCPQNNINTWSYSEWQRRKEKNYELLRLRSWPTA